MNGDCKLHGAVNVRLDHLEDKMKTITRMFWAIIIGLVLNLAVGLENGKLEIDKPAKAAPKEKINERVETVRRG